VVDLGKFEVIKPWERAEKTVNIELNSNPEQRVIQENILAIITVF